MSFKDELETMKRAFGRFLVHAEVEAVKDGVASTPTVLNTAEAAKLAGRKPRTIQKWVRQGRLSPLGGPPYRFKPTDVEVARDRSTIGHPILNLEGRADDLLAGRQRGRNAMIRLLAKGLYYRGHTIWLRYKDEAGCWQSQSSGFKRGSEQSAERLLATIHRKISVKATRVQSPGAQADPQLGGRAARAARQLNEVAASSEEGVE